MHFKEYDTMLHLVFVTITMNILNNLKVLQPYNLERSDNKIRIIVITHTIDLYIS